MLGRVFPNADAVAGAATGAEASIRYTLGEPAPALPKPRLTWRTTRSNASLEGVADGARCKARRLGQVVDARACVVASVVVRGLGKHHQDGELIRRDLALCQRPLCLLQ